MLANSGVGQPHIDAVVVEKEYAFASPVLQYWIDECQRKPLVSPWIDKEKCGNESHFLEHLHDLCADLFALYLRFVFQLALSIPGSAPMDSLIEMAIS